MPEFEHVRVHEHVVHLHRGVRRGGRDDRRGIWTKCVLMVTNGQHGHFGLVRVETQNWGKMSQKVFWHGQGGRKWLPVAYGEKTYFWSKIGFCHKK